MLEKIRNKKFLVVTTSALVIIVIAIILLTRGPKEEQVKVGQKVTVTVTAESVDDMYGYQFQMNYHEDELEYTGELQSNVQQIQTIFAKPFDGYQLVGATLIGEQPGITGNNLNVCEISFTALRDVVISESNLFMSDVGVVSSDLTLVTDIPNWDYKVTIAQ
jgi:hypothetical protein